MIQIGKIRYSLAVIILSMALTYAHAGYAQQSADVYLGGHKMEPKVQTSGSGMATVTLNDDSLMVEGDFEYLTANYSGAYIMFDIDDRPDNQLFALTADPHEDKRSGSLPASKNQFQLSEAEKELLRKGKLYIIISSFDHRNGEIRGNIKGIK